MSLFIFRRDLRISDNLGFINAIHSASVSGQKVYAIFILNPEQIDKNKNPYFSNNSVQFMCESLRDLNKQLFNKLNLYYGPNEHVIEELLKTGKIKKVFFNLDYTGYSQKRDSMIEQLCKKYKVECLTTDDVGLLPIGSVKTSDGKLYSKFTPFYEKIKTKQVPFPVTIPNKFIGLTTSLKTKYSFPISKLSSFYHENKNVSVHGGRDKALDILDNIKEFKDYNKSRDYPAIETTRLSAYLKYGCVSVREAYYKIKKGLGQSSGLLRQLYWREFYLGISKQYPEIMKGKSLKPSYENIKWEGTLAHFNKWKEGMTGFPIVDAGMREMNITGYMHNRCRMIVSSFLIKTLLRNWRDGEKYFAQMLVDYDFSNNNGGWQWSSGSGTDSQPYFRIFNPWSQSEKYDPDAEYIKRWIPELTDVPAKDIHRWNTVYQNYKQVDYPKPIVDYTEQKEKALKMYEEVFKH
jgi:deoxyribodipyrimidine photo-lyase